MKEVFLTVTGVIGGLVANALGGFDAALATLIAFMAIDYLTGLVMAAMGKSEKSDSGGLESCAGWKGLFKKGMCLVIVYIGVRLDMLIGTEFVRDAVIIAFITNELLSIIENAGVMGIPIPIVIKKAIDILNKKGDKDGDS